MHILISNDDGIHAPGLQRLHSAATGHGTLTVVAPNEEQSAVGHAITIFDPIKVHPVQSDGGHFGYAVHGTPADCVKLAVCELMDPPPDLVLSGINLGSNTGISIIYSGTVSAATEACVLGVPAVAFSLCTFKDPQWDTAENVAVRVLEHLVAQPPLPGLLLNVNIPNLPLGEIRGLRITRMAKSRYTEIFHKRTDPRGNQYYWLDGEMDMLENPGDTDVEAVGAGYVSITPIGLDLTHPEHGEALRDWESDLAL